MEWQVVHGNLTVFCIIILRQLIQWINVFGKMSEFVCFELDDDNDINLDDERVSEAETVNDTEFNDDTEFNKGVEKYYAFANVSREYDMRLETLLQVLIFHKSWIIIVLMMMPVLKWLTSLKT